LSDLQNYETGESPAVAAVAVQHHMALLHRTELAELFLELPLCGVEGEAEHPDAPGLVGVLTVPLVPPPVGRRESDDVKVQNSPVQCRLEHHLWHSLHDGVGTTCPPSAARHPARGPRAPHTRRPADRSLEDWIDWVNTALAPPGGRLLALSAHPTSLTVSYRAAPAPRWVGRENSPRRPRRR